VGLAVLAHEAAVGIDDGGGVVVHTGHVFFVDRHDDNHAVLFRILLHEFCRVSVGNFLGSGIPLPVLSGTEVGLREYFLEAQHLHALLRRIFDVGNMRLDHPVANFQGLHGTVALQAHLDQTALHFCHEYLADGSRPVIGQEREFFFFSRCYRALLLDRIRLFRPKKHS
jgi:hypothetical protein